MPAAKTLHDVIQRPQRPVVGSVPQAFHRHGPVGHTAKTITDRDGIYAMAAKTETEKLHAYGVIAAGDAMVPASDKANNSLIYALRKAVSHSLMTDVGAYPEPIVMASWLEDHANTKVYYAALEAMAHYGTANQESRLKKSMAVMRKAGLRAQANMLATFIESAIGMAREFDHPGLDWLYTEFHSLYGNEQNPNPKGLPKLAKALADSTPIEFFIEGKSEAPESEDANRWGSATLLSAPMIPWKHPRIRSKASWKYSEFGVFKYPWRALPSSDYRCFSLRRSQYAGTLLIDMSGSMSIQQAHVNQILDLAPYSTIACYGSAEDRTAGRIVLIAADMKKGAAAWARGYIGSGNVIDGPALKWLASQAPPRIWISDGMVTGIGDHQTANLVADAAAIQQSAKITRIPNLETLIAQLT